MENILFLLNDHTFRVVALGCSILGICYGVIGSFAFLRKQSLLGDAIAHASLPGVCISFLLTNSKNTEVLLFGALITGIICIWLIQLIQTYTKIKFDSILAFILSVFFGLGLVLLSYLNKLPGANKAGLNKFIFGQASTLLIRDVLVISCISAMIIILIAVFWKEFKVLSFDPDYAEIIGVSVRGFGTFLSMLTVICIIIGIQTIGVILVSAMLISPAAAARQWTQKLSVMVILAGLLGGVSSILGTVISSSFVKLPTGPVIAVIASLFVFASILFSPVRGIIFKALSHRKRKKQLKKYIEEGSYEYKY